MVLAAAPATADRRVWWAEPSLDTTSREAPMESMLALVSKAIFERDAHGLGEGDVWPTAAYLSKNRALVPLAEGGDLFLCTVRPPDERLWLVAVLRSPEQRDDGWHAATNVVPITDIGPVLPRSVELLMVEKSCIRSRSASTERAPESPVVPGTAAVLTCVPKSRLRLGALIVTGPALAVPKVVAETTSPNRSIDSLAVIESAPPESAGPSSTLVERNEPEDVNVSISRVRLPATPPGWLSESIRFD